jgi:hypothetical protein
VQETTSRLQSLLLLQQLCRRAHVPLLSQESMKSVIRMSLATHPCDIPCTADSPSPTHPPTHPPQSSIHPLPTCSTSALSLLILAISASLCSSGDCLLRSSSCWSSYFLSVSCRIWS